MAQDTEAGSQPQAPDRNEAASPVIVVGLDGSPSSWNAFCWAAGEARRVNSRIVAVHVIPLADAAGAFAVPFDYAGLSEPGSRSLTSCSVKRLIAPTNWAWRSVSSLSTARRPTRSTTLPTACTPTSSSSAGPRRSCIIWPARSAIGSPAARTRPSWSSCRNNTAILDQEDHLVTHEPPASSPFAQPKAVWAVAFACVISFMGIGLVDPILPALAGSFRPRRARCRCCSPATWSSPRSRCS